MKSTRIHFAETPSESLCGRNNQSVTVQGRTITVAGCARRTATLNKVSCADCLSLLKNKIRIAADIESLTKRIALNYSKEEYERYKKLHPETKKQPNDPLFQVKNPQQAPTQQAPVQQAPVQQAPAQQAPVQQAPVQQAPAQQAPAQQAPAQQAPAQQAPVQQAPVQQSPVQQAHTFQAWTSTGPQNPQNSLSWQIPLPPPPPKKQVPPPPPKQVPPPPPKQKRVPVTEQVLETLRKGPLKTVRKVFEEKKEALSKKIKTDVKEIQTAGEAIKKFVNKQPMSAEEIESVKKAASKLTEYTISMTLGGHVGLVDLAQHFAVEGIAEAAVSDGAGGHSKTKTSPISEQSIVKLDFKDLGSKVKDTLRSRKKSIIENLKTKLHEVKEAGSAISNFVRGKELSKEEHHALKQVAKEVAAATMFAALGPHFGMIEIAKFFAIGSIAQAAVAGLPKHGAFMKKGSNEQDIFIEMIMENVMKQLEKMQGYTPQQLRELAKKIRQNVEKDPNIQKEMQTQFKKR